MFIVLQAFPPPLLDALLPFTFTMEQDVFSSSLSVISIVTIASISFSGFYFFFNVIYLPLSSMKLCTFFLCSILEKHHFILLLFCSLTVGRYLEIVDRFRTSESMLVDGEVSHSSF